MTPSRPEIGCVIEAVMRFDKTACEGAIESIGGELDDLHSLVGLYRELPEYALMAEPVEEAFASLLVVEVGSNTRARPEELEVVLQKLLASRKVGGPLGLVTPNWVLSRPLQGALQRRYPSVPVYSDPSLSWLEAYRGLAHHVEWWELQQNGPTEMSRTSVPWRVVAIAECLFAHARPAEDNSLTKSVNGLRARMQAIMSPVESAFWKPMGQRFVDRRNGLTHLPTSGPESFGAWASSGDLTEAKEVTSAIGVAVSYYLQRELAGSDPDGRNLARVVEVLKWF